MPSRFTLIFTFGLIASLPSPAWADAVKVAAGEHAKFGRMTFIWPAKVGYKVETGSDTATLTFDRPIKADLERAVKRLPTYLSDAKIGADGRTVRFSLRNPFELRVLPEGKSVILDFWPHKGGQPKAAASAPKPTSDSATEKASVPKPADLKPIQLVPSEEAVASDGGEQPRPRSGEPGISVAQKADFTRIVFPWKNVGYRIERNGAEQTYVFNRRANPDLSPLNAERPKGIDKAAGRADGDTYRLSLWFSEGYTTRRFDEEKRLVVDVIAPKSASAEPAETPKGKSSSSDRKDKQADKEDKATDKNDGEAAESKKDDPPVEKKTAKTDGSKKEDKPAEKIATAEEPKSAPPAALSLAKQEAASPVKPAKPADPVLQAQAVGKGGRLTLTWPKPVPSAVFERAGQLWAVFGAKAKVDLTSLPLRNLPGIGTVEQVPNEAATVLRMPLAPGFSVNVGANDAEWSIDVLPQAPASDSSLAIWAEPHASGGGRLRVEAPQAAEPILVKDSVVGDMLAVIPMQSARGLGAKRAFVDLALLPSAQGLVVERHSDDLNIQVDESGVTLSVPGGLTLSATRTAAGNHPTEAPAHDEQASTGARVAPQPRAKSLAWRDDPAPDFGPKRAALEREVGSAAEPDRTTRRFDLAQLYLRNGLTQEAFGLLNLAATEDPSFAASAVYRAARGKAEVLMGRNIEAEESLNAPELAGDRDALLWRAAALAGQGKWQDAAPAFAAGKDALNQYPTRLQARFQLAAARAAMETGDLDRASKHLAAIPRNLPKFLASAVELAKAEIVERGGDESDALTAYKKVADTGEGASAAAARLRATVLAQKLGRLERAEAVASLEKLRYAWRGDETELGTIEALGNLYLSEGRYREAFAEYAEAGRLFPDSPRAERLQDYMKQAFADLFLRGKADGMEPVKALGLFLDYRDLTPVGKDGDDMIRKLADRLAAVDLLDQAQTLLEHQIDNRLEEGVAKAQVAAKLAALALLNHDPQRALQAIRNTRQVRLPDDLNEKRRILEAQAQMQLGSYDQALELVERFATPEADTLRAEIHWRAKHWPQAAASLMALLDRRAQGDALPPGDRQTVMKAAISYALAGDQAGLASLRSRYADRMAKSPDADGFEVLTGPVDVAGVAFRELAAKIAGLDSLQGFLKSYTQKL